jgi:hypothetical protein
MKLSRTLSGFCGTLVVASLLALVASCPVRAEGIACPPTAGQIAISGAALATGGLCVTPPGPVSVLEGTNDIPLTWLVTNRTAGTLYLDYALWTISYESGDPTDNIEYPVVEGFVTPLTPGQTGAYTVSPESPGPLDSGDNGIYDVDFTIEMSPTQEGLDITSPIIVGGCGFWAPTVGTPNPANPGVLNDLVNCSDPAQNPANFNTPLFPGGIIGLSAVTDADENIQGTEPIGVDVTVNDAPEPGTLLLFCSGLLGLGCITRREVILRKGR